MIDFSDIPTFQPKTSDPTILPFDIEEHATNTMNNDIDKAKEQCNNNKQKYYKMFNWLMAQLKDRLNNHEDICIIKIGEGRRNNDSENSWSKEIDYVELKATDNFIHVVKSLGYPHDVMIKSFHYDKFAAQHNNNGNNYLVWKEIIIKLV